MAAVLFVGGALFAWRRLPADARLERWDLVLFMAAVLVPGTVLLNAFRFWLTGRLVGREPAAAASLQISLLASAANFLPLPGAAMVRIQGLRELGVGTGSALASNLVMMGFGLGVGAGAAGVLALGAGQGAAGAVLLLLGLGAFVVGAGTLWRMRPPNPLRFVAAALGVETLIVAVAAARLGVALAALGSDAGAWQAMVLTLAAVASSAVGVVPDGIGVREAAAAGLAVLVDLPPSVGYLASALDRVVALAVMVPLTLWVARRTEREARSGPS